MGYRANEKEAHPKIDLPMVKIADTLFYADTFRHEFKQVDDPYNRFSMGETPMWEGVGTLYYDKDTRNLYLGNYDQGLNAQFPPSVLIVIVPPLNVLDPENLGHRIGIPYTGDVYPPNIRVLKCSRPKTFRRQKRGRSI